MLPALIVPLLLWPAATGGSPDAARMAAALVAVAVGLATGSVAGVMPAGGDGFYPGLHLTG